MKKVTYIIPIHKADEDTLALLEKALVSIDRMWGNKEYDLTFTGPEEVVSKAEAVAAKASLSGDVSKVVENEKTDPFNLINKAVMSCTTKWFSILEHDDTYMENWLKSFNDYTRLVPDASMYMPICEMTNGSQEGSPNGFINEIVWASSFATNYGFVDETTLEYYKDHNITGAFINTEDFIAIGGLKPSFGIAAWYELLLRLIKNGKKAYVVPRVGYVHIVGRKGSYADEYNTSHKVEYVAELIKAAKEESTHKEERVLTLKAG